MLSAARKKQLNKFLSAINIKSDNLKLFDEALTHPSYNFEENRINAVDYERLEFLGDSVVRLILSNFLYEKYKKYDEGKLTKLRSYLVCDEFFAKLAVNFGIGKYINIGIHEEKDGGRCKESILACTMESIFGAIYLSCGFDIVKNFIYSIYNNIDIDDKEILYFYNSKEILQQYTQSENKDLPKYKVMNESGLAHNKIYDVSVSYNGKELGRAFGKTKKEAEKKAAFEALKQLKIIEDKK